MEPVLQNIATISRFLKVPLPDEMLNTPVITKVRKALAKVDFLEHLQPESPIRIPAIINLADRFHDFFLDAWKWSCGRGTSTGTAQAMCLLCGELLCLKPSWLAHGELDRTPCPCSSAPVNCEFIRGRIEAHPNTEVMLSTENLDWNDSRTMGPLSRHSFICNGGDGCFILLKQHGQGWEYSEVLKISCTIIVHDGQCATSNSIYIDVFGQDDLNLQRGVPLTLCKERLDLLKSWILDHNIPTQVCKWRQHIKIPHDYI